MYTAGWKQFNSNFISAASILRLRKADKTPVSSASKSEFFTSSIVSPGRCNFSCSREERMEASLRRLKTETFG